MTEQIDHLRDTLAGLMEWFLGEDLEAAVIGGVAAGLHGHPRLTEDVASRALPNVKGRPACCRRARVPLLGTPSHPSKSSATTYD